MSERYACRLTGWPRSTARYRSAADDQRALRGRIAEMARSEPTAGYRRLTALLKEEGWQANHKRVHRLYRQLGLSLRRRDATGGRAGTCARHPSGQRDPVSSGPPDAS